MRRKEGDKVQITLRAARVNAGLTLDQVSQKTGYDRKTLANWENGINVPRADKLFRLCALYGIPLECIKLK